MNGNLELLIPIILPVLVGTALLFMRKFEKTNGMKITFIATIAVSVVFAVLNTLESGKYLELFRLISYISISLRVDEMSIFFSLLTSFVWLISAIYTVKYLEHEERKNLFYGFFLITYGVLIALDYSSNMFTFYLFYELMTMVTIGLVIHSRTRESVHAAIRYLIYSLFGAFLGLIAIFYLNVTVGSVEFVVGGSLADFNGDTELLLVLVFVGIVGFCTKAGMFPLHGWLPVAHPAAPAPASAVLSGIITKAGVLAVIRLVYYVVGADFVRGTWVQTTWLVLTLITVIMGSVMAYNEKILKKRLAYSTVSQVSYVLFGLALLNELAFTGALLHVVFHSIIKVCLFLAAGSIIFNTHETNVDELRGVGKKLPYTMLAFTIASLGLVGIPPLNAFLSKWYLAEGSLLSGIDTISWVGPIILLASAIFTAGYLIIFSIDGFFLKPEGKTEEIVAIKESKLMVIPMLILAVLVVVTGVYSAPLFDFVYEIAMDVFNGGIL